MIDIKDVEQVFELAQEIKELETKKKILTDSIKDEMLATGQDTIVHNGNKIQLVKSFRMSVKKGMKDKLILFLKNKNLSSCISLNPDINKESLETEINLGKVTQQELDQYINNVEVNSIRVTLK